MRRVAVVVGYTCNRCGLNSSIGAHTEREADSLAHRAGWATVTTDTGDGQVVTHLCRRCDDTRPAQIERRQTTLRTVSNECADPPAQTPTR